MTLKPTNPAPRPNFNAPLSDFAQPLRSRHVERLDVAEVQDDVVGVCVGRHESLKRSERSEEQVAVEVVDLDRVTETGRD